MRVITYPELAFDKLQKWGVPIGFYGPIFRQKNELAIKPEIIDKIKQGITTHISNFDIYYSTYEPIFGALKLGMIALESTQHQLSTLCKNANNNSDMIRTTHGGKL